MNKLTQIVNRFVEKNGNLLDQLTPEDLLHKFFEEQWFDLSCIFERKYYMEDISLALERRGQEMGDEDKEGVCNCFQSALADNEHYWESYWMLIDKAIDEVLEQKEVEE